MAAFRALKLFVQTNLNGARVAWATGALQAASRVIETLSLEGWPHDGALELVSVHSCHASVELMMLLQLLTCGNAFDVLR